MIKKRIPTIFALLLLLSGFGLGLLLVERGSSLFLQASPEIVPSQIKITNLSDSVLTLSWITQKETRGFIIFGETSSLGQTALDERNQLSGESGLFFTHYITLRNLKPKTKYFYKFGSAGKIFDLRGKPYEFTTAPTANGSLPPSDVASGIVLKTDNTPAEGALVYFTLANMTPQSTLIRSSGNWLIPLNTAYAADLSRYASYDKEAQVVEIFVQGASLGTAQAITTTKNDNPVPKIVLGKTYDFRQALTPIEEGGQPQPSLPPSKFSSEGVEEPSESSEDTLTIISPSQGENITTQTPEFFGTGTAGKTITIVVESSEPRRGSIQVDNRGVWRWTPPANLTPGLHTLKVTLGNKSVSRAFVVLASEGDSPAFTATPSAQTPTPTRQPTATPSLKTTPSAGPTLTPTASPTSTLTSTPTPTGTTSPAPTMTTTPTPTSPPSSLQPGNSALTALVTGTGLILILLSFGLQILN